ncbi:hypothetical protein DFH07DRAFT_19909 [Mycena maculata]|uniref:Uncharacterized protein n=1 Tax=Mycena maculata TaxID=230809 RepID=A0AAD7ILK4_9AGAR|nr:hypothetical protein DFH07DRAFT_19909 [Mycena maculata]
MHHSGFARPQRSRKGKKRKERNGKKGEERKGSADSERRNANPSDAPRNGKKEGSPNAASILFSSSVVVPAFVLKSTTANSPRRVDRIVRAGRAPKTWVCPRTRTSSAARRRSIPNEECWRALLCFVVNPFSSVSYHRLPFAACDDVCIRSQNPNSAEQNAPSCGNTFEDHAQDSRRGNLHSISSQDRISKSAMRRWGLLNKFVSPGGIGTRCRPGLHFRARARNRI